MPQPWRWLCREDLFKDMISEPQLRRWLCREDLFKDMMSEREDVAAKRARCMAAQGAFREALGALEVLPQQLVTLTSRASQPLPPDLAWSEAAHNAKKAAVNPGERSSMHG